MRLGDRPLNELSLYDACLRYYAEVSQGTTYGERGQLYHFKVLKVAIGGNTLLSALDDELVNQAVQKMRNRPATRGRPDVLSGSTINRYLTTLSRVCERARKMWGVRVGAWSKALHTLAEPSGREVYLDQAQARQLLDHASGHLRPILLLEMMTGLRRDNVVLLAWEGVSLDLARLVLRQKGDRRLTVPLPPPAVELLHSIEPDAAGRRGPVFRFGNPRVACQCPRCAHKKQRYEGQPIRSIKRAFRTALDGAGLRDLPEGRVSFHTLRHSFASWLLAECGDLKVVQETLGHAQIASTVRYAHLLPGRKEAAVAGVATRLLSSPATAKAETKIREAG